MGLLVGIDRNVCDTASHRKPRIQQMMEVGNSDQPSGEIYGVNTLRIEDSENTVARLVRIVTTSNYYEKNLHSAAENDQGDNEENDGIPADRNDSNLPLAADSDENSQFDIQLIDYQKVTQRIQEVLKTPKAPLRFFCESGKVKTSLRTNTLEMSDRVAVYIRQT